MNNSNIINVLEIDGGFASITSFIVKNKVYNKLDVVRINEPDRKMLAEINEFFIDRCMANGGVYKNVLKAVKNGFYKKGNFSIQIIYSDEVITKPIILSTKNNDE